jgi:hypothetical protein
MYHINLEALTADRNTLTSTALQIDIDHQVTEDGPPQTDGEPAARLQPGEPEQFIEGVQWIPTGGVTAQQWS